MCVYIPDVMEPADCIVEALSESEQDEGVVNDADATSAALVPVVKWSSHR